MLRKPIFEIEVASFPFRRKSNGSRLWVLASGKVSTMTEPETSLRVFCQLARKQRTSECFLSHIPMNFRRLFKRRTFLAGVFYLAWIVLETFRKVFNITWRVLTCGAIDATKIGKTVVTTRVIVVESCQHVFNATREILTWGAMSLTKIGKTIVTIARRR